MAKETFERVKPHLNAGYIISGNDVEVRTPSVNDAVLCNQYAEHIETGSVNGGIVVRVPNLVLDIQFSNAALRASYVDWLVDMGAQGQ